MPDKSHTLKEACLNPDGKTYNGYELVKFLYHATTGKHLSDEQVREMWRIAQAKALQKAQRKLSTNAHIQYQDPSQNPVLEKE